jgi:predicted RecB family nuclease
LAHAGDALMQRLDGRTVYAATDLVGFLECEHLTALERSALVDLVERPVRDDPELAVLRDRGIEHEHRFLEWLQVQGHKVVDGRVAPDRPATERGLRAIEADAARTADLMRQGADVIYQATLFNGTWLGYVDFLVRVEEPSGLGSHAYEVFDTKLARRTKGGALLQMCVYSELVAAVQDRMPEWMHVALGGSGHRVDSHRLADYAAYYRTVKGRFLTAVAADHPPVYPLPVVPDPVAHCGVCRWESHCGALRVAADHLSGVAGLRNDQAARLAAAGIGTMADLAALADPLPEVEGLSEQALGNLRAQAALQVRSRGASAPEYELLPVQPNLGLAALPEPDQADLFFDIEGDPYAEEDGLEYLLGVWDPLEDAAGRSAFASWWAHTRQEEKRAFEGFVDFVMERWHRHPGMHVYHYAAYERTRIGLLSTRHATREREVDSMLRGGLFVDLYRVVRQSMRVGVASYSIKKLEPLYALQREIALRDAGSSIVRYEDYIRSVSAGAPDGSILQGIADYNRDDCRSTQELRDWLEARRTALATRDGTPPPRPGPTEELEREPSARDLRLADLVARLLATVPAVPERRSQDPEMQALWLLANLLEWHRREEKADWWAFFDRCGRSDAELEEDEEAIGQIRWVAEIGQPGRSVRHRYAFDPGQPYHLREGDEPANPATALPAGTIVALDPLRGTLELQWSRRTQRPHPTSLIPRAPFTADAQKAALERIGEWVAANGIAPPGRYQAIREFLLRLAPRAGQEQGTALVQDGTPVAEAARSLGLRLDRTVLPIQGPPGAGKTYVGAEMILALVAAGRRVGITAFTHRALTNLLDAVLQHAADHGQVVRAIRKLEGGERPDPAWAYTAATSNQVVAEALATGSVHVAAGTSWLWSRPEMEGLVDTLFVDEAGQLSLATVVSVAGAAAGLVLLGDPQQLSQVKKGAHPEGVDLSALEFALDGAAVIRPERGIFLPETYRLHPDVNRFTSEIFYEDQLRSAEPTLRQDLEAPGRLTGTGVRWLPVPHAGNRNASHEEAAVVADLYRDLLDGSWTDQQGVRRRVDPGAILVASPYNAQVELLAETLEPLAGARNGRLRVGTVDKIQGQEAAAVIYSMATSSQDQLPRSMEFLYSLNRLNVATSRGRCLSVVVCSPQLLGVSAHTPFQMRLANALCRFVELAGEADAAPDGGADPDQAGARARLAAPEPLTLPWGPA